MSLQTTPSAQRLHIGFFGCRNAGKSSLVNAVTGQDLAVVSEVKGTTTDPVMKAMELLPLGPVVIIDTPGYDDEGLLGEQRVMRTKRILNRSDLAVLVVDGTSGIGEADRELLGLFRSKNIPHLVVMNKADLIGTDTARPDEVLYVSALTGRGIEELKERLGAMAPKEDPNHRLLGDLISPGDLVVLVCPIDESAPKGRIILPQQQAIRDILDTGAMAVVCRETELEETFRKLGTKPSLTVTDSQAFGIVDKITPDDIPLTSFSILMARYKGFLKTAAAGAAALGRLRDGDRILMAEGCTHHRQCNDIGTVKIPRWILKHTGKDLVFETCSGREFPEDLSSYAAVIHCGGCMITERDVQYRMRCALDQNVPFTNYGIVIAAMTGALERSTRMFPDVHKLL
jgi:[FeFe] hydrogenase H-cluster maturation GTPase HydF